MQGCPALQKPHTNFFTVQANAPLWPFSLYHYAYKKKCHQEPFRENVCGFAHLGEWGRASGVTQVEYPILGLLHK